MNANNVDGVTTAPVAFTSANYTTAPSAPASIAVQQQSPRQVLLTWAPVADVAGTPKRRGYVVFKKTGGGAFVEVDRPAANTWVDDNIVLVTTNYQYKVRTEDINGNESADSSTTNITPSKLVDDTYIASQGVSGPSIANGSVNRGRTTTSTGSGSGSVAGGSVVTVGTGGNPFTFWPNMGVNSTVPDYCGLGGSPVDDQCVFNIRNNAGGTQSWFINYRYFNT